MEQRICSEKGLLTLLLLLKLFFFLIFISLGVLEFKDIEHEVKSHFVYEYILTIHFPFQFAFLPSFNISVISFLLDLPLNLSFVILPELFA